MATRPSAAACLPARPSVERRQGSADAREPQRVVQAEEGAGITRCIGLVASPARSWSRAISALAWQV